MSDASETENSPVTDESESDVPASPPASPGEHTLKKRLVPIGIAAGIAALLIAGLWLSYKPVPDQLQGMVDAREVRAASKVTGRIEAFHVEEGAYVTVGQILYTVDSPEVAARSQQAGGALAAAQAVESKAREGARPEDIRAAEAQWRRAKAAADLAQVTYERMQRLHEEGVIAGQNRDEAEALRKPSGPRGRSTTRRLPARGKRTVWPQAGRWSRRSAPSRKSRRRRPKPAWSRRSMAKWGGASPRSGKSFRRAFPSS